MEIEGNGTNKFHIVIKCPYEVYDGEWFEILSLLNNTLQEYKGGKYINIVAHLEDRP